MSQTSQVSQSEEELTNVLVRAVGVAQSKGAFDLVSASSLYKVILNLKAKEEDLKENKLELSKIDLINKLVEGVQLGQSKGSYTLDESHLILETIKKLQETYKDLKQVEETETESEDKITEL